MIEYVITLTKGRSKRLVSMAENAGYDDELAFINDMINALTDDRSIGKALAEWIGTDDSKRLEHTEK